MSSIDPRSWLVPIAPSLSDMISGRRATETVSPVLAPPIGPAARIGCPPTSTRPAAASTTVAVSTLSVPTKRATNEVRGKL